MPSAEQGELDPRGALRGGGAGGTALSHFAGPWMAGAGGWEHFPGKTT